MPDGIYLDARKLGEVELARQMYHIINDKETYYDFFKWHRYYSFHGTEENADTDDFCVFCSTMNDLVQRNESSIYVNIAQWWNGITQVTKSLEPRYRETANDPVTRKQVSQQKITHRKKKTRPFRREKPFRQMVSHTTTKNGPVTIVDGNNTTTTIRPALQTQGKSSSESIIPINTNTSLDQANGSSSLTKPEFEFEYDYER